MSNFLTGIVLDKIESGIEKHAQNMGLTKYDLYIKILPGDEEYNPVFALCNRTQTISEISFADFIGFSSFLGFDVAGEGEVWIKRFLIMSANDNDLELYDNHFYFLRIKPDDTLQAYMYIDDKPFKEIKIDYILNTK